MLHAKPMLRAAFAPLLLAAFCLSPAQADNLHIKATARAAVETEANFDDDAGGSANADDPAIWVHPRHPARSLVLGTLKEGGLAVYSLKGATLQRVAAPASASEDDAPGRFNNVDIVEGFMLGGQPVDLAVVTDRGHDTLRIYRIHPDYHASGRPPLEDVSAGALPFVFNSTQEEVNDQTTAYGLAVMADGRGGALAAVSRRERSRLALVELQANAQGKVSYRVKQSFGMPASFTLPDGRSWSPCQDEDGVEPQFEGMVIDPRDATLYAAQEQVGIWKIPLREPARAELLDKVRSFGVPFDRTYDEDEEEFVCSYSSAASDMAYAGRHITADAEGLTILQDRGHKLLFASSQGDSSFVIYDLQRQGQVAGTFRIVDGKRTDGAQHSDGAAVVKRPLGPDFPQGLLVVHDGENLPEALDDEGEARENTNFKFVRLEKVIRLGD